jgi:hypothetical protein
MLGLEEHTEVVEGIRRWRLGSELERRYQGLDKPTTLLSDLSSFRGDVFVVLKEMGFRDTFHPDVLSLGDVEVIWDLSGWLTVKNRYRTREIFSLNYLFSTIRFYSGSTLLLDDMVIGSDLV